MNIGDEYKSPELRERGGGANSLSTQRGSRDRGKKVLIRVGARKTAGGQEVGGQSA